MVQSQALVASKHHLIETDDKTLSPNKLASSDYNQQFPVARKDLYLNYAARDQLLDQLIETDYVSSFSISDLSKKINFFSIVVILNLIVIATVAELSSITQNRFVMQNLQTLLGHSPNNPIAI